MFIYQLLKTKTSYESAYSESGNMVGQSWRGLLMSHSSVKKKTYLTYNPLMMNPMTACNRRPVIYTDG